MQVIALNKFISYLSFYTMSSSNIVKFKHELLTQIHKCVEVMEIELKWKVTSPVHEGYRPFKHQTKSLIDA